MCMGLLQQTRRMDITGGWFESNYYWLEDERKLWRILTGTPWGPSGPGNPVSPIGPLSPCQRTEAARVSVCSDKGMMPGLTAQRESDAVAHRLSWDPWFSTSAGLPLPITHRRSEHALFDRSSIVSHHRHLCSFTFIIQLTGMAYCRCTVNPPHRPQVNRVLSRTSAVLWELWVEVCYSILNKTSLTGCQQWP